MRLMTNSPSYEGLISIQEASETAPQNVIFTLPIDRSDWKWIKSFSQLQVFLQKNKFGANIYDGVKKRNVILQYDAKVEGFVLNHSGKRIEFFVDPAINFKSAKPNDSPFLAMKMRLLKFYKYLLRSVSGLHEFKLSYEQLELKNEYVGTQFKRENESLRFIVLSLNSTKELDALYFEDRTFFVN